MESILFTREARALPAARASRAAHTIFWLVIFGDFERAAAGFPARIDVKTAKKSKKSLILALGLRVDENWHFLKNRATEPPRAWEPPGSIKNTEIQLFFLVWAKVPKT